MKPGDGTVQIPYNELSQDSWLSGIVEGVTTTVDVEGGRAMEVVVHHGYHNPSMKLNVHHRPGTGNTLLYRAELRAKLPFISGIDTTRAAQVAEAARQRVREEQSTDK